MAEDREALEERASVKHPNIEVARDDEGGTSVADTLARLAERLAVAVDCSECCIYEYFPARDVVVPKALWALELSDDDRTWVGEENHLHRQAHIAPVLDERRVVVTQADEEDMDPTVRESMAYWGEKTALYAPISHGDELLGILELIESRERREFGETDRRLAMGLADVAALAIANARTSSAAETRNRHLAALLESSRALGSTMIIDEVLQVLAEHAGRAIDAASSFIYEYVPDEDAVIWRCQYQRDGDRTYDDPIGTVYPLDFFPIDVKVIHEGEIIAVSVDDPDLAEESRRYMREWDETSMLSVPLIHRDEVVGLMEICESEYVRTYTEDEVELVRAISEQAAVAIRNAQLFRREEWRNERLVRLLEISQVVGASLDPAEIIEVVNGRLGRVFGDRETRVTVDLYGDDVLGCMPDDEAEAAPEGAGELLVVPLMNKGKSIGDLTVRSQVARPFEQDERELVQLIANQVAAAVENGRLYDRLEAQAITDGLTGLYNHRYFYDRLKAEVTRARRYGFQLSLLMLDLDDFKRFNDEFGHQAGDHVLAEVGELMREQLRRDVDVPCRYGGEEFAIILPHTPSPGAETVGRRLTEKVGALLAGSAKVDPAWLTGERVRKTIADAPFPGKAPDETTHITVSVGVATFPDQSGDAESLVGNADKALYVAKHDGKNRVVLFG